MALKNLTTAEMIQISTPWIQGGKDTVHALLQSIEPVRGLLPVLAAAHEALVHTQPGTKGPSAAKLADVSARALAVDRRHDSVIRGVHAVLSGYAELATDPTEAEALLDLRDALLPDGVMATQRSYRDEAGQVELLDQRITAEHRALLKRIKVRNATLHDAVDEWKTCGRALGKLEDERIALTGATPEVTAADAASARNKWIRVVNALTATLDLVDISATDRARLFDHLTDAAGRADRRGSGKKDSGAVVLPPAPPPAS